MRAQWFPIYDEELATFTFIAPRTGYLIVTEVDVKSNPLPILTGYLLGAQKSNLHGGPFPRDVILDLSVSELEIKPGTHAILIRGFAYIALKLLPLSIAFSLVKLICTLFLSRYKATINEALILTSQAFGRRSKQDCLVVSLCRHILLSQLKVESKIVLGAHVPTRKMHAWVQIGDHPILECPDVLVHYQTCVIYQ